MKPDFSIQQIHRYEVHISIWGTLGKWTGKHLRIPIVKDLGKLAVIVVFLILLLITMQFYSVSTPIIIMTTVYLAAAAGVLGSFITGMPIGFMSIMGIVSLAGIVVRNGIVVRRK